MPRARTRAARPGRSLVRACVTLAALVAIAGCSDAPRQETVERDPVPDPVGTIAERDSGVATVRSITDGDTIRTTSGDRVRLLQIDAPEAHGDVQCWGPQASAALAELIAPGDVVRLERDPDLDDRDAHGRLLRYVIRDRDDLLLNLRLVRDGDAAPYFFHAERGAHAAELLAAATAARRAGRGLWGACPELRFTPNLGL